MVFISVNAIIKKTRSGSHHLLLRWMELLQLSLCLGFGKVSWLVNSLLPWELTRWFQWSHYIRTVFYWRIIACKQMFFIPFDGLTHFPLRLHCWLFCFFGFLQVRLSLLLYFQWSQFVFVFAILADWTFQLLSVYLFVPSWLPRSSWLVFLRIISITQYFRHIIRRSWLLLFGLPTCLLVDTIRSLIGLTPGSIFFVFYFYNLTFISFLSTMALHSILQFVKRLLVLSFQNNIRKLSPLLLSRRFIHSFASFVEVLLRHVVSSIG